MKFIKSFIFTLALIPISLIYVCQDTWLKVWILRSFTYCLKRRKDLKKEKQIKYGQVCHLCVAVLLLKLRYLLQFYIYFHHGSFKQGFTTDNYSSERRIDFILNDIFLNTMSELLFPSIQNISSLQY